jgi:2-polyprenyl-6-methoxyphenol hydroxylase-like FAD-dependent oxidoreductase
MTRRTQVAVVGAGPAGLLLAEVLQRQGVESIVVERRDRAYVEARIRAGVLETGTVEMMRRAGAAERLEREGLTHDGIEIAIDGHRRRVDFRGLVGASVTVYGQTEMTKDLGNRRAARRRSTRRSTFRCTTSRRSGRGCSSFATAGRTRSRRISSPAATASTARAGRAFPPSGSASTSASIRSPGWESWPTVRRPPTN